MEAMVLRQHGRPLAKEYRPIPEPAYGQVRIRVEACGLCRTDPLPDDPLDAAIIFAPVGNLVPAALRSVRKGGTVVCTTRYALDDANRALADLPDGKLVGAAALVP